MIGYLDLPSGISGDMLLGCLVDAGWPPTMLEKTIHALHLSPQRWSLEVEKVMRGALQATLVHVKVQEEKHHRHLADICQLIDRADLSQSVKARATGVFRRLARAEAAVHGCSVEEVHFHEVGALDAIIDIVGGCAGLEALQIEQLYASPLPLGPGWTQSAHGPIPLPAPATLALLAEVNAPNCPAPGPGELVTPTGAALVAELARFEQPAMRLVRVGLGAGQKNFDWPNIARLWLAKPDNRNQPASDLIRLETNIDDMNPELYAAAVEELLALGALDVWTTPIQMKKGRPALQLNLLVRPEMVEAALNTLFYETTTLGVRASAVTRYEAGRDEVLLATPYGTVRGKRKHLHGQVVGTKPEFEDCRRLAQEAGTSLQNVYAAAIRAAVIE